MQTLRRCVNTASLFYLLVMLAGCGSVSYLGPNPSTTIANMLNTSEDDILYYAPCEFALTKPGQRSAGFSQGFITYTGDVLYLFAQRALNAGVEQRAAVPFREIEGVASEKNTQIQVVHRGELLVIVTMRQSSIFIDKKANASLFDHIVSRGAPVIPSFGTITIAPDFYLMRATIPPR